MWVGERQGLYINKMRLTMVVHSKFQIVKAGLVSSVMHLLTL